MINYKNTLNLPHTEFPMRANLPDSEIKILKDWYENNLYEIIRIKKNKKKLFLLHDGPPYANGQIHLGHAINKILKDIILKFKGLSGYNAPYIPGWDCHGLPIELKVEQLIKKTGSYNNIDFKEFCSICRKYALEQIEIQKRDFIRLGVLGDWTHPYLTMDFKIEANIIRTLRKIISNGYLYRGIKPVYWCTQCCSVLANSEVEYYHNHCSNAVYVGFVVANNTCINKIFNTNVYESKVELIIWTTNLWTLPANQAISVHPDYIYQLIKTIDGKHIIIAAELVNVFMKCVQCISWVILGQILGGALEYLKVKHPFMLFNVPIILSKHITLNSGTGIVHIAPNHGIDDYFVFKKYKLKSNINSIVDEKGYYVCNIHPDLNKLNIFESNSIIIQLLRQSRNFLHVNFNYQHSYPYCWRHKTPLIFRITSQWFLDMDHMNLREKLLKESQKVVWIPSKGYTNMQSMIINRPDWCLSRQRVWGIPIPIFVHKKTEDFHPNTLEFLEKIAKLVENNGIQVWWDLKIEEFITDKQEANCYKKLYDVLDVWFDSGSTHDSVILDKFQSLQHKELKIDLYVEGSDQYRGWFMSSLITSVAINNKAPYKQVLSHGFTVDSQGNKMSKSLGNIISPKDIIDKFGSDVLRLWIASSDYSKDMTVSDRNLKSITEIYRRIRNTIRFCLANLNDFNPNKDLVLFQHMIELDRWAINHALSVQLKIISNYDNYQFHSVIQNIMQFCSIEMGSFYLDIIKDRQYTLKQASLARRSCQTALYHILEAMVRWISPILSFTADDIWKYIPGQRSRYVFTEEWYTGLSRLDNNLLIDNELWDIFIHVRSKVNKVIEQARTDGIIKGSLEAKITLYADSRLADKLRIFGDELAFGLITSSVTVVNNDDVGIITQDQKVNVVGLKITLEKAPGQKCLRCWNYTLNLSQNNSDVEICSRCVENVFGVGENRKFF
ncbi:isoleucyl-tRNA synthetase [Candidatus Blochmanniella vafra str. BVAF]|uniref:Isoleucine--tRNA ligase n=1 Tax=Blochmanniella vafra (strain BVAF) TaxID=859654 RepID=E8Q5M9_BLOVB|nr:isoleucine--tRNA ligase [Candidatus Blochmannia vafer]ADV33526.1 isoleucyl-tRNA synthetase [Candidatus Blochmannia vafer str. BVAF]